MTHPSPFRYFKTSPEIIRLAVMLYVRDPLSLRNVEDLLHERGIEINREIVRFWWNRFGPMFAAEIRRKRVERRRTPPHWRWHMDELYAKINGLTHYLLRAFDHEGEVLEAYVSKTRDRKVPLKFLRKTMKRHGHPQGFVTDKVRSFGAALKDLGLPDVRETGRCLNNRAENSLHGPSVHIRRSDDRNAPSSTPTRCDSSRNSPQSTPPSTTCSTETAPSQLGQLQGQSRHSSQRVASTLRGLTLSGFGQTETGSHWSDSTLAAQLDSLATIGRTHDRNLQDQQKLKSFLAQTEPSTNDSTLE